MGQPPLLIHVYGGMMSVHNKITFSFAIYFWLVTTYVLTKIECPPHSRLFYFCSLIQRKNGGVKAAPKEEELCIHSLIELVAWQSVA